MGCRGPHWVGFSRATARDFFSVVFMLQCCNYAKGDYMLYNVWCSCYDALALNVECIHREYDMAVENSAKAISDRTVTQVLETAWMKRALELQQKALIRARSNEIVGSEIYVLRTKEIEFLGVMIARCV